MVDPAAAATAAAQISDENIDGGTSRTYLLAWLANPPSSAAQAASAGQD